MKPLVRVLLVASCVLFAGCIVRSIYPWLPDESRVTDVSLAGTWHDAKKQDTAFFTPGNGTNYNVLLVSDGKDVSRFAASLHRLDDTLLLVVGPEERDDMGEMTQLPGFMLFKVDLEADTLKLFGLDMDSFGDRVDKQKIKRLEEGDANKGYVLLSPTDDLASFVKSQLEDESFFDEEPLYVFKRPGSP